MTISKLIQQKKLIIFDIRILLKIFYQQIMYQIQQQYLIITNPKSQTHKLMVVFQIIIHARTQKVQSIQMPADGQWHFKIKCSGCGQPFPKQVSISTTQKIQIIKQEVNFQAKCKNCSRKSTILILQSSPYKVSPDQYGNIKHKLALFDCRGVQITEVIIGNSLTVTCVSGTVYQNADFNDLWAEYDEKLGELCQVQDVKFIVNRV